MILINGNGFLIYLFYLNKTVSYRENFGLRCVLKFIENSCNFY